MKPLLIILSTLLITSCASDKTSSNLYSSTDIGRAITIKACTVISSRVVTIRDKNSGNKGESLGFFAGSVASRKNNNALTGFVGGLIGGAIGRNVSDKLHSQEGVEYTVILRNGDERQLVQDIAEGETLLQSGDACRLQISNAQNRVLAAKAYPKDVKRPSKVGFTSE